jgi:serine/threonine-protein kinase 24/25/MST4
MGRAAPPPPLSNGTSHSRRSTGSGGSYVGNGGHRAAGSGSTGSGGSDRASSITVKNIIANDLPPLPPSPAPRDHDQSTVRRGSAPQAGREPSDEYDDFDDPDYDTYHGSVPVQIRATEDELPESTMLDSVVLPAIASASGVL